MSKEKLTSYFNDIQKKGHNLFIPYIMAGDTSLDQLKERILFLQDSGVAAIELGIPFSDPVADGPIIQQAGIRALNNGTSLSQIISFLKSFKNERDVPIVLMAYLNPVFAYGIQQFASDCKQAGVSGVIIPDLPLEEENLVADALKEHSIAFIRLAALTSTDERLKEITRRSEGFLYAVSVTGTTGERASYEDRVYSYLQKLKDMSNVPVLAGFGVSNATQAKELSSHCDGVIVGSKIVKLFHEGKDEAIQQLIEESL